MNENEKRMVELATELKKLCKAKRSCDNCPFFDPYWLSCKVEEPVEWEI